MLSPRFFQAKRLNLTLMSANNQSRNKTAFTVSIEAKKGITTGISAKDRAKTIRIASKKMLKKMILFHLAMYFQ